MNVSIRGTRKHTAHQLHISTWHSPNWFERWFMLRRAKIVNYVGKGTVWFIMELGKINVIEYRKLKSKSMIEILKKIHP